MKIDPRLDRARPRICILEDGKLCDDCCECYVCDIDPDKICDSCGKCLETADYSGIIVDGIIMEGSRSPGRKPDRAGGKRGTSQGARRFRIVRKES